jgi:atypical dual specificity phosphatase
VRGVINFCEEYEGPVEQYKELGIQQLYLPTTDHFEPSLDDLVVRDL